MAFASRFQQVLAAMWAGILLAVGGMAAPSLFAVLDRSLAGLAAGRIFAIEAYVSLVLAMALFFIERQRTRQAALQAGQSVMSAELMLVMGALFATVLGHFALSPMIVAAKAGQGSLSFGTLHAMSSSLFLFKGVLVLALAWRLTGRR
ncbi:MAG: DUF4149 domain-containing protein [Aquabacterium sp.]|uniref:DUF4149 domain-containing protein n=1 Tax=Aquabacterium sp. TaxID=1872578 RepID=UPI002721ABD9|nr:DUF4149 domain-containing protein [Aquabacterium sp.]MDO9003460.1 DUF4149 domain-containing protein [Aquabacterium sp.]